MVILSIVKFRNIILPRMVTDITGLILSCIEFHTDCQFNKGYLEYVMNACLYI